MHVVIKHIDLFLLAAGYHFRAHWRYEERAMRVIEKNGETCAQPHQPTIYGLGFT